MKAIGRIAHVSSNGDVSVDMFYGNNWQGGWILTNKDDMPVNHPDFGLFEFEPSDQFCKWINPNE